MVVTPTTWNPADKAAGATLSNGNLTVVGTESNGAARSVFGASSGKWYWEYTSTGDRYPLCGVARATATISDYPGADSDGWGWYSQGPTKHNGSVAAYGSTWTSGQVVGVAMDLDNGTLEFFKGGVSMGVAFTNLSGTIYAMTGGDTNGGTSNTTANFGATAFSYTPPAGFQAGFGEPLATYALSGLVRNASGTFAARTVRAFREDTGAFVGTAVSDGTTGAYSITTADTSAHTLVAYPAGGEALPALVLRGVVPIES